MKRSNLRIVAVILGLSLAALARAETPNEVYSVDGKNFTTKAAVIRYIVSSGKRLQVLHTRCEILTNKFSFKACPKSKMGNFENEQFQSLSAKSE